jgi:hypothetical protein
MKKSSAQAWIDVSLTKSLLSTQFLARFEVRSKEEEKGGAWELEGTFSEGLVEWNEWVTVRKEGSGIYTLSENQPFRSEPELSMQIARTSGSTLKHRSQRSPLGLLAKGARTSSICWNFQQLCGLELPAIAGTSSNFVSENFQLLSELLATLRPRTSSNSRNFQQAKVCKVQLSVREVI